MSDRPTLAELFADWQDPALPVPGCHWHNYGTVVQTWHCAVTEGFQPNPCHNHPVGSDRNLNRR